MKGIPNADDGFLMVFSAQPFPDADFELEWLRPDGSGNAYQGRFEIDGEIQEMQGWLCPALNLYYPEAPKKLYCKSGRRSDLRDKQGKIIRLTTFNSSKIGSFCRSWRGRPAKENSSADRDDQWVHKLLIQAPAEISHSWTVNVPPTR